MISLYNILVVARIEVKTLFRSWFFRIFSIIAIGILGFWAFAVLSPVTGMPWVMRGIPSTVPYVVILFLNSLQAVIAVFLASDFLKRDRKYDTTEVVYMRSMTNGDYVLGKTAGILFTFLCLNFAVLLITLIMHLVIGDTGIMWETYLLYPLIISLPTLVFILGLSFLLMVLIRNQAITFIVILGYIATTLFYLAGRVHYIFDYISYNIPLMYSDFTGFSDVRHLLMHRGIYLLLGLSFISITIFMIKRLPQSKLMTGLSRLAAVVFFAAAVILGISYINDIRTGTGLREKMVELGNDMIDVPVITPVSCSIDLEHTGNSIRVSAGLIVRNDNSAPVEHYIFTLNPGLIIDSVSGENGPIKFSRDIHLLSIDPAVALAHGETDSIAIAYHGQIDEDACYPDILETDRESLSRLERAGMMNLGKRYSFIDPDYVLLTPGNLWYPSAGPLYSSDHPETHRRDCIDFSLDVTTKPYLTAISQGLRNTPGQGRYSFAPETTIPSMTLAIGNYEHKSISVDSVEYSIWIKEGHDFFSEYFDEIGDTLSALIRELRQETENRLGLDYPYRRVSIVEVPIHFHSYRQLWSVAQETVQPEIVLLPEKGLTFRAIDFRRLERRMKRRKKRSNETVSNIENQSNSFTRFVKSTLTGGSGFFSFRNASDPFTFSPSYNLFPNFLTFTTNLESADWPVLNMALEAFYAGKLEGPSSPYARFITGMSPDERINLALEEKTLQEIMADEEKRNLAHFAIKSKGDYLFLLLESLLGKNNFNNFLSDFIDSNRFRNITDNKFIGELNTRFGFDFAPHIDNWYNSRQLPAFLIGSSDSYKVLDGDRERYQVRIRISNPEPVNGLLKITFRRQIGQNRGGFFRRFSMNRDSDDDLEKYIAFEPGETKDLGFIIDYQPGRMEINTLISRNIPSVITLGFTDFELRKKALPFDGERKSAEPVQFVEPGEIIVDNEDAGFNFETTTKKSMLKKLLPDLGPSEVEKYVGLTYWKTSGKWLATTDSKFYGKYVRSAHFTSSSKGTRKASWSTELAESGYYDIYCYVSRIRPPWRRHNESYEYGSNHFLIYHDDGVEDTKIELNNAEDGWNFLGSYYISEGTATVEITDKSDKGRFVIADAIKWVKR